MNVLLISPHTDDVELGCGGTLYKLLQEKHNIFWVVFSITKKSRPNGYPENILKEEFLKVIECLKLSHDNYSIYDFEVRNFNKKRQDILDKLIITKKTFKPDLVIGPSLNDFHQDHNVVANEMYRAFKSNSSIISYEFPWNHINFNARFFSRLKEIHIKKKWEMLSKYETQIALNRNYFSEDYIKNLAKVRGIQCGSNYAEAFEVIKWII